MKWFVKLSTANKIAIITLFVTVFASILSLKSGNSADNQPQQSNTITINGKNSINGDVIGGNKIINNEKGSNYLEEKPDAPIEIFQKDFLPKNDGEFKYNISLTGKINKTDDFRPFRVEMFGNDPSVYAYNKTLNSTMPFYNINQDLDINWLSTMKPIYAIPINDNGDYFYGYPSRIQITNITDYGEDVIINNSITSIVKRIGDADRIIANMSMAGSEEFIKLKEKIKLEDGEKKVKFKKSDFVTLRPGETIILEVPYLAERSGVYLPKVELSFKYAGADGKLTIEEPEIIVPKIAIWSDILVSSKIKTLSDKKDTIFYAGDVGDGEAITYWDDDNKEYIPFSFSIKKFSKDDLSFLGKVNLHYYRNEAYALKGGRFKSSELMKIFENKLQSKFKPKIAASDIPIEQFSDIEKHNIELSLAIENNSGN